MLPIPVSLCSAGASFTAPSGVWVTPRFVFRGRLTSPFRIPQCPNTGDFTPFMAYRRIGYPLRIVAAAPPASPKLHKSSVCNGSISVAYTPFHCAAAMVTGSPTAPLRRSGAGIDGSKPSQSARKRFPTPAIGKMAVRRRVQEAERNDPGSGNGRMDRENGGNRESCSKKRHAGGQALGGSGAHVRNWKGMPASGTAGWKRGSAWQSVGRRVVR